MDAKELNQIRNVIREELKPIENRLTNVENKLINVECRLTNLENIVSTLATKEELYEIANATVASFKIVLERLDRIDGRLEILEEDLKLLSFRFGDIRDMVISNQIELHNHSRAINNLEIKTLKLEKTIGLTQEQ